MISRIVGQCHVGQNYRAVMREVISRLKDGRRTYDALPKSDRRHLWRAVVAEHNRNRDLYCYVMGGMTRPRRRS